MLAIIRYDAWDVLNMQFIIQIRKDGIIQTCPVVVLGNIKRPTHMVEGDHQFRKRPQPPPTTHLTV